MKRLLLTIAAVAAVAGPMAIAASDASAQDRGHWDRGGDHRGGGDRWNRDDRGRGDDRRDDRGDRRGDRYDGGRPGGWNGSGGYGGGWDDRRNNGYYYNNRWSYGPPPSAYYGRPGFRPGYNEWRRGGYLPPYYRGNGYVVRDYGYYRLRPPPRGYYWYRTGDDFVLAAIATGLIFDIISH